MQVNCHNASFTWRMYGVIFANENACETFELTLFDCARLHYSYTTLHTRGTTLSVLCTNKTAQSERKPERWQPDDIR